MHPSKIVEMCATTSSSTLERLRLHSIVSYIIVWWMQAAQASCGGEAQHQKKGRCTTISNPTLERLRLNSIVSYSIVWWIQAAQASYSGEAQHHRQREVCHHKHPCPRPA